MWTGDKNFFNILQLAGGDVGAQALQDFIDTFDDQYNKLERDGFKIAPMQASLTFEQLEKNYGINAMATVVDIDSPGTPISEGVVSLQTGKIPWSKKVASFDANDYRQMLINSSVSSDRMGALKLMSQESLLDKIKRIIDSHTNLLTYQRHQMVSKAKYQLTEVNNKGGIEGTIFTAKVPDGNITTLTTTKRWWTNDDNSTEGSASKPTEDLQKISKVAARRGRNFHWEVDSTTLSDTLGHSQVIEAIGYSMFPAAASATIASNVAKNAGREAQIASLEKIIGFPIKEIDSISAVDSYDKVKREVVSTEFRSFEPNVWSLVPDGNIGEWLSAQPIKVDPNGIYAEYYGGRLMLTYDYDARLKTQNIESEMASLMVPDKPKYMYILNVK